MMYSCVTVSNNCTHLDTSEPLSLLTAYFIVLYKSCIACLKQKAPGESDEKL